MPEESNQGLSQEDRLTASDRTSLPSPIIYETVRNEGHVELERPLKSLSWSGFAAGIALSLSIYGTAFLHSAVGGLPGAAAIESIGYTVGFLIVILGRLQLFTENTITAVLPLLADFTRKNLLRTGRLWGIVFLTNMAGSFFSAFFVYEGLVLPDQQVTAVLEISQHLLGYSGWQVMAYGVPAGFLVAALVWLMPASREYEFWVISIITYMIALGGLTHVVAGSTEWFFLALDGQLSWLDCWLSGILPALVGNIIGGTGLFAIISYGQVKEEL